MRILFVTPYVPSRIRVRPFHFIRSLGSSHAISLVSLVCDQYEAALVPEVAEYCVSVDLVRLPRWQAYTNCLRALPSSLPLRVAYYQSSAFVHYILRIIREYRIDVVHAELIKVVPAMRAVLARERIPIIYDAVDCITSYLEQQRETERNPLRKAFISTELKKMGRYESASVCAFDSVVITSNYDRDYLTREYVARFGERAQHIQVVPNGVDTQYFAPLQATRESDSLVFCAKMDYYPNAQAMFYFCREVLPCIWARRPQVRLTIVGNNPPRLIRDLASDERITVTGYVQDIRPYLSKASVALAPLLVAAGMQNKVLEALAMATPLAATPAACRALSLESGKHLLIAENAQTFAAAILRLLDDPQLALRLGHMGRHYVEQHYSWQASADMLDKIYKNAIYKIDQVIQ
ncbi:MAG TPA: glycosyltransferase [Ktedonobacteraceae bacterium]|nr:glycosyltransferase [Ktedonobacteraceae bacterium]